MYSLHCWRKEGNSDAFTSKVGGSPILDSVGEYASSLGSFELELR